MSEKITINPVTRISGFLEIEVTVENHKVIDAKTKGRLFRGFELMLKGRDPLDAIYYSERICGICSTAHSLASSLALEKALNIIPTEQEQYLRDFMHGCEFIQNHIRHFYQFTVPDYIKMPQSYPLYQNRNYDYRLPKAKNDLIQKHYFESLEVSRHAHQMLAEFGGKAPHNHGVFVGGTTMQASADKVISVKSILFDMKKFIDEIMIPDAGTIAQYYGDYYDNGQGYGNLLSYGCFDYKDLGTLYLKPQIYIDGSIRELHTDRITEEIDYSWYTDQMDSYHPMETIPVDDQNKTGAYSWIKSSRLENRPFECGPLARQWLSGEYRNGISTMDRTVARVLEVKKITEILSTLLDNIVPGVNTQLEYEIPVSAAGAGLTDTTRGALGHWLKIDQSLLSFYQIITPSVWNLSSHGNDGFPGTAEKALIGTEIENEDNPVELGRVIRSFDPCVSCATHVIYGNKKSKTIQVVP